MDRDLLLKLQRQRLRMGETGSPLRDGLGDRGVRTYTGLDCEVHVKERALKFQHAADQLEDGSSPASSARRASSRGRVCLDRWERPADASISPPLPAAEANKVLIRQLPTPCRGGRQPRQPLVAGEAEGPEAESATGSSAATPEKSCPPSATGASSSPHTPPSESAHSSSPEGVAGQEGSSPPSAPGSASDGASSWGQASTGAAFETQVLRPLRDWLLDGTAAADGAGEERPQAPCFSMTGPGPQAHAEAVNESGTLLSPEGAAAVLEHNLLPEGHGPLEYDLLDLFDQLPDGLVGKLKGSLDMHQDLVRQLFQRYETLQAKARAREGAAPQPAAAAPRPRPPPAPEAPDEWRRELRAQMAGRVLAAQEARLRLAAEAHEAAMRAKLEYTRRAAQERIALMSRRAEREEEECRNRAAAARLERERVRRSLESARRELDRGRSHLSEAEDEIKALDIRARVLERARKPRLKEADALRSELKAHRARAARHQGTEQRVRDLQRELEATLKALSQLSPEEVTAEHFN